MPLDIKHIDDICKDIKYQYENGIATCALFKMSLDPEGNPPTDKATQMCRQYKKFKEKLDIMGVPNGVLVQSTIGHGRPLGEKSPYQQVVGMINKDSLNVVCPYDEGFREYMYDAFKKIALTNPDHIMLDDDFRLICRYEGGCGCHLHMKRFNELAGTDYTREELLDVLSEETPVALKYNDILVETQRESLVGAAKVMRSAIDSVNPKIPGSYCCVDENAEFAAEIAGIMAGEGNLKVLRINNGRYCAPGSKFLTISFFKAACQIAKVKDYVDVILDEPDTCPQNRYSTSKMMVHSHLTGSILEGVSGAKHWITRLIAYEPESGTAYRQILQKNRCFYDKVMEIAKCVKWEGFRIPVLKKPYYRIRKGNPIRCEHFNAWGYAVLERLGLPMYFSAEDGGIACLEGDVLLSDNEILNALSGFVILASDSAQQLVERGFGKYIGVNVREWKGKTPRGDKIIDLSNVVTCQKNVKELIVTDETASVDSCICSSKDGVNYEELFPGTVIYRNTLGGTVVTYAGTPKAEYNIGNIFSFLNWSRKQQIIKILKSYGDFSAYYPGDEEMYFRSGTMSNGTSVYALFNLGFDPVDNIELVINRDFSKIYEVMSDGSEKEINYKIKNGKTILDCPAYTLDPVILLLK